MVEDHGNTSNQVSWFVRSALLYTRVCTFLCAMGTAYQLHRDRRKRMKNLGVKRTAKLCNVITRRRRQQRWRFPPADYVDVYLE